MRHISLFGVVVFLFILTQCSSKQSIDLLFTPDFGMAKSSFQGMVQGRSWYSGDSCSVLGFIDYQLIRKRRPELRIVSNTIMSSYTCPESKFSFTMLKGLNSDDGAFYGFFDVYYVSRLVAHPPDSGRLVPFENEVLKNIVNEYAGLSPDSSYSWNRGSIRSFLYHLYFDDTGGTSGPVFEGILDPDDIVDYVSPDLYAEIRHRFSNDIFVFKDSHFGLIIFEWAIDHQGLRLNEFVVPFRQYFLPGSDVAPLYPVPCR